MQYIVCLRNETADNCNVLCDQSTYEHSIPVKSDSIYNKHIQVYFVNSSTCFCASVMAENGAGSSASVTSLFYEYKPIIYHYRP